MKNEEDKYIAAGNENPDQLPENLSRRAVIKGGVTAMPAILTLHSGAALARSSNLISASPPGTTDGMGRTLCVDERSVMPADDYLEIYDLGEPPSANVTIIRGPGEREYFAKEDNSGPVQISPDAMCERGGRFYWRGRQKGGWQEVSVNRGFVVSAGAMASISAHVKDNLI